MSDFEIRDKVEINLPPRLTMQITALTITTGKTMNDIIVEAIIEYLSKKKNSHSYRYTR